MRTLIHGLMAAFLICAAVPALAADRAPSVLIAGGVHAKYVARPLHEMGIELDTCPPAELPARLESGRFNVLVLPSVASEETLRSAERFLADGGGVLALAPGGSYHNTDKWQRYNRWLAERGARPRWEALSDPATRADSLGMPHAYSANVSAPVNAGVEGLFILARGRGGAEYPMSFDFSDDWSVVVRAADTTTATPLTGDNHEHVQEWIPATAVESAPPLMALRGMGKGRLAVVGLRSAWSFTPPSNCPTVEVMLTAGLGGTPSGWLRVFANTMRWLAEPSLAQGRGGADTPREVLYPPVKKAEDLPPFDWANHPPMQDQPQVVGLVGARTAISTGSGTVAEYAGAARQAGLDFIVFLEDSLKMDQAAWDRLVQECAAQSDGTFGAVPGLTIEDAQGNHLFVLGDGTRFPKPEFLLPDRRLKTLTVSRTEVMFDYIIQQMNYDMIDGFWNHADNELHFADYKLHNAWCLYSRGADGKTIDDSLDEYLYWQGCAGEQALFAFEFMNSPAQVAERARDGWKIIGTSGQPRPPWVYAYTKEPKEGVAGLRQRWEEGNPWIPQYQYVTQGPRILAWQTENNVVVPWGEWWRPDVWQFRVRLHAASEAGIRSIEIHDGDRGIFRRFLPNGAKSFEHTMVLSNCRQRDLVPIVEDMDGRRAVGMSVFNRNTMMDQFICGDRCNFLGRSSLRTRDGRPAYTPPGFRPNLGISPSKGQMDLMVQPDLATTLDAPTLPIDGRPLGAPEFTLTFQPGMPGELARPFSYPTVYLIGPDMGIGQGTYRLGYDPTENGAEKTRLGHAYVEPEKQGHIGRNAWTSWYRLVPLEKLSGWARIHVCGWMPEQVRMGWFELYWKLIDDAVLPEEGIQLGYYRGECSIYRNGEPVAETESGASEGRFERGAIAVVPTGLIVALDDQLRYRRDAKHLRLFYTPEQRELKRNDEIHLRIAFGGAAHGTPRETFLRFAEQFGISRPGNVAYAPTLTRGRQLDNYFTWRLDGEGKCVCARIPQTDMHGHLTAVVENLNDNWSVFLQDRARKWPNHRGLPIRDGRAYAQLDLTQADTDFFIGHPVTADDPALTILVAWMEPGKWFVEAHNPSDEEKQATLASDPDWQPFTFAETVALAPGSSRVWEVEE